MSSINSYLKKIRKKKTITYIVFLLLFSIYPRFWELTQKPPLIVDEPANLRMLNEVIEEGKYGFTEFHWDFSKTILSYYPTILLLQVAGSKYELLALRVTSVFYSMLALIPFFFIVKKYTNDEIALATTLLFSSGYFFLQFSRVGWVDIMFVITLGLYLFLALNRGIALKGSGGLVWTALSGFIAGLMFYGYRSNIIFIGLSLFFFTTSLFFKKAGFKITIKYLFTFLFVFFVTAAPWILKAINNTERYNLRARVVDIRNVNLPYHGLTDKKDIYMYQIKTSIDSFILLKAVDGGGAENPRYLPIRLPPFNIFIKLSFWIGLLLIFTSPKLAKKGFFWLTLILATVFIGQVFTVDPPNGARAVISLPAYYVISSLTFYQAYKISGKSKLVLTEIIIFALVFSFYDIFTYRLWMDWIKV